MKATIQRVKSASLKANNKYVCSINNGLLVLVGIVNSDTPAHAEYLAKKIANLRIFCDDNDKMNLSVKDKSFEVLAVSNFTLAGNAQKGNRPSFTNALNPQDALVLYNEFCNYLSKFVAVKKGVFKADMEITTVLDGPVTININSEGYVK